MIAKKEKKRRKKLKKKKMKKKGQNKAANTGNTSNWEALQKQLAERSATGGRRKKRKRGDGPDATAPNFIHRPGHVAINPETKKVLVASAIKL